MVNFVVASVLGSSRTISYAAVLRAVAPKTCHILILAGFLFILAGCDYEPEPKVVTYDAASNTLTLPHPCPDWSHPSVGNYDNSNHSNFGCAANTNFGLQVADPHDYVEGHGDVGPDTETTVRVIERYRAGEIPEPLDPQQASAAGGE